MNVTFQVSRHINAIVKMLTAKWYNYSLALKDVQKPKDEK